MIKTSHYILITCAGLMLSLLFCTQATAQSTTIEYQEYTTIVDNEGYECDLLGTLRVSDNGKYAVGSTASGWPYYFSYLVDIESRSITYVNEATGEPKDFAIMLDVADDGLMVGAHTVTYTVDETNSFNMWTPCVRCPDSEYVDLPIPASIDMESLAADGYGDYFYTTFAKRVSPDGKVILGQTLVPDTVIIDGVEHIANYFEPIIWYFDPTNGKCTGTKRLHLPYESVNGFIPYDMSDDGEIIVGRWTTEIGDALPAMANDEDVTFLATPSDDGITYWRAGTASCIDDDGNIYYCYPSDTSYDIVYSARYNIHTCETTELGEGVVVCGANGLTIGMQTAIYGPAVVMEGDSSLDISQLVAVQNISDDGKVIAGGGIVVSITTYNYPAFIIIGDNTTENGIEHAPANTSVGSDELYTITGQRITTPMKGVNIVNGKKILIK